MKWNPTRVSDLYILHEIENNDQNDNNQDTLLSPSEKSNDSISELEERLNFLLQEEEELLKAQGLPTPAQLVENDNLGLNKKDIDLLEKLKDNISLDQILTMKDDSDESYDESYDSEIDMHDEISLIIHSKPLKR